MHRLPTWRVTGMLMLMSFVMSALPAYAVVPAQFDDQPVVTIGGPTAFAFLPDESMLITQQNGQVTLRKTNGTTSLALDLTSVVCTESERGVLGIAVHPTFPAKPYVYIYYTHRSINNTCVQNNTAADPFAAAPFNRVARFTMSGDTLDLLSETVLIDRMPSYAGNHNGGDVLFGKDGLLYISVGDSGCYYADNSKCAGANPAAREEFTLLGKILRVTDDGAIPDDNPYKATGERCNLTARTSAPYTGKRCQETFAWGLRNPFRIAFDPNAAATRFFINDVGQGTWEEVNEAAAGADYGWNVREGHCANGSTSNCGPPPAGMTNPIFDYQHTSTNSQCNAGNIRGNSITGGAFVPNGVWPSDYDGDYLVGEYVCGKIFRLQKQQDGSYSASEFATGLGNSSAVHMAFATVGGQTGLYYTTYASGGQVRRITYTGTLNRTPQARLSASPTSGPLPLDVQFDASASSDADNDSLTYAWDFGDGQSVAASSNPAVTHRYAAAGNLMATVTVSDGKGGVSTASVRISAGNTAPVVAIEQPTPATRFAVGQTILLQGSATDAEDGVLASSMLTWTVTLHHNEHTHPYFAPTTGLTATLVAAPPEDLLATQTSFLELSLSATDSQGVTTVVTRELRPALVNVTFATEPAALQVDVNGVRLTGPQTVVSWQGYQLNTQPVSQHDAQGNWLYPTGWKDGGPLARTIVTPSAAITYTVSFGPGYGILLPSVVH